VVPVAFEPDDEFDSADEDPLLVPPFAGETVGLAPAGGGRLVVTVAELGLEVVVVVVTRTVLGGADGGGLVLPGWLTMANCGLMFPELPSNAIM